MVSKNKLVCLKVAEYHLTKAIQALTQAGELANHPFTLDRILVAVELIKDSTQPLDQPI